MFKVFNHTLRTHYTSQLVYRYARDTNKASLIWADVVEHANNDNAPQVPYEPAFNVESSGASLRHHNSSRATVKQFNQP